ncbi:hypothetical protein FRB96_000417 [Tulasnella sp. 330]|nr:hypothetical protein FRB96_000417 [Tulasnella sp. 330]
MDIFTLSPDFTPITHATIDFWTWTCCHAFGALLDVECGLNPSDLDVVQNALATLVQSTRAANPDYLVNPDADPNFERKINDRLSELVKIACLALIREADIKACDLRL